MGKLRGLEGKLQQRSGAAREKMDGACSLWHLGLEKLDSNILQRPRTFCAHSDLKA